MTAFTIQDRRIGEGAPPYIVAEISANHLGDFWRAEALVKAAAEAGADAVKLQTYTPDTLTIDCDAEPFRIRGSNPWTGRNLYSLYQEAQTPWEWHEPLKALAERHGIQFFSSPFDVTAVEFLDALGVPAFKIASFEIVDVPLLRAVGATGKPAIVSTGMADESEIREAVQTLIDAGCPYVALLHCVSAYPAPPESMNLRAIPELAARFGVVTGLSDHTLTTEIPAAAAALGASIIEKHLVLHRAEGGPDAAFSLEPKEFRAMVHAVRTVEKALGDGQLSVRAEELSSRSLRRSLFAVCNIEAGECLTRENVRSIRPGNGLHPRHLDAVLGQCATRNIPRGTPLTWDDIADSKSGTQSATASGQPACEGLPAPGK